MSVRGCLSCVCGWCGTDPGWIGPVLMQAIQTHTTYVLYICNRPISMLIPTYHNTGKVLKTELRAQFKDYRLPDRGRGGGGARRKTE